MSTIRRLINCDIQLVLREHNFIDRNSIMLKSNEPVNQYDHTVLDNASIRDNILPNQKFTWIYKWLSLTI